MKEEVSIDSQFFASLCPKRIQNGRILALKQEAERKQPNFPDVAIVEGAKKWVYIAASTKDCYHKHLHTPYLQQPDGLLSQQNSCLGLTCIDRVC